jgi:hypothetical protein
MNKALLTTTILLSASSINNAESVVTNSGEQFDVTPIAGDGDCAFNAIQKSRADVVAALKSAVNDHDAAHKGFDASRKALHDAVAGLTPNSSNIDAVLSDVESFIAASAPQYAADPDVRNPSKLAESAVAEFRAGLGSFSEEEFHQARLLLQSRIHNMYYERYEAFQEALKQELMESGISKVNLENKAGVLKAIDDVFAKNNGKASWLPMGLIFGVNERLGLNLAVWSSRDEPAGKVKLYQFNGNNVWDPSVIHVRWNGGHFDRLVIPSN